MTATLRSALGYSARPLRGDNEHRESASVSISEACPRLARTRHFNRSSCPLRLTMFL